MDVGCGVEFSEDGGRYEAAVASKSLDVDVQCLWGADSADGDDEIDGDDMGADIGRRVP